MLSRENVQRSLACIQEKTGRAQAARVGLVLGSGLGGALEGLQAAHDLPCAEIEGFPRGSVAGHAGRLVLGSLGGVGVAVLSGRVHLYEGFSAAEACHGVRVLGALGCKAVVLTNAAGSLDASRPAGSLLLIADHINMTGQSPLTGPNVDAWGPRFPDCGRIYSPGLRALAMERARALGIPLSEGVYMQVCGPQYETPAETRAFRRLGADAVGMSTAIEALAAAHMGLEVLGLSCLTNLNVDADGESLDTPNSHEDVVAAANRAAGDMGRLIGAVVAAMGRG
ncbi:MAG: purine-nucleoside phosphorylase [Desulfovibrionaceae bacterium]